jgi:glucose/arabinose dehydrogenase
MTRVASSAVRTALALPLFILSVGCADDAPGAPGATPDPDTADDAVALTLTRVIDGLRRPVYLTAPANDDRLFIVEKGGRILVFEDGALGATPFLDVSDRVSGGNEQGLLSVAFHPDYASNGAFFVDYTDRAGDTRVVRYRVSADPNAADPASAEEILSIDQPYSNHNGGHLLFGPDGMLYVTAGDGGSGGDPRGNGQNLGTRLGAILRIDVNDGDPFGVPPDNPLVGQGSALPEIWLWGVRNPWRIAFDRESGDLYVADVGQNRWEEITVVGPGDGGANLGWNATEGRHCYASDGCTPGDYTLPQVEYGHGEGCSVTGGVVYRGPITAIRGRYFYSDYCEGWLRSFRFDGAAATEQTEWDVPRVGNVTSFGEDSAGRLYVLTESAVWRLDEADDA